MSEGDPCRGGLVPGVGCGLAGAEGDPLRNSAVAEAHARCLPLSAERLRRGMARCPRAGTALGGPVADHPSYSYFITATFPLKSGNSNLLICNNRITTLAEALLFMSETGEIDSHYANGTSRLLWNQWPKGYKWECWPIPGRGAIQSWPGNHEIAPDGPFVTAQVSGSVWPFGGNLATCSAELRLESLRSG
jgi:hypothetical protein